MSDSSSDSQPAPRRCPHCDTVVAADAGRCLMCGGALPAPDPIVPEMPRQEEPTTPVTAVAVEPLESTEPLESVQPEQPLEMDAAASVEPPIVEPLPFESSLPPAESYASVMGKRRTSKIILGVTAVIGLLLVVGGIGYLISRAVGADEGTMGTETAVAPAVAGTTATDSAIVPQTTPLAVMAATATGTPTLTPSPTVQPTVTPTAPPTPTLQPPRPHTVSSGETLIGLAARYRVSIESIAALNGFGDDVALQIDQNLQIPWPTATPPLVPVGLELNGEFVVADPTDCQRYEVLSGDSIVGIAARFDIDYGLLMKANRMDDETLLQPGDTVCIPDLLYGQEPPPTPGPSPTPAPTQEPPGPRLLYPVNEAVVANPDGTVTVQWTAVRNLNADEWYMVEVGDLATLDRPPYRGFTRDTALQLPASWRPTVAEERQMRWQVSIIKVTDWRADGLPIYTYGGQHGGPSTFYWMGAVLTPTPAPTVTPTVTFTPPPPTATAVSQN